MNLKLRYFRFLLSYEWRPVREAFEKGLKQIEKSIFIGSNNPFTVAKIGGKEEEIYELKFLLVPEVCGFEEILRGELKMKNFGTVIYRRKDSCWRYRTQRCISRLGR